jgi:hypothetical protein
MTTSSGVADRLRLPAERAIQTEASTTRTCRPTLGMGPAGKQRRARKRGPICAPLLWPETLVASYRLGELGARPAWLSVVAQRSGTLPVPTR